MINALNSLKLGYLKWVILFVSIITLPLIGVIYADVNNDIKTNAEQIEKTLSVKHFDDLKESIIFAIEINRELTRVEVSNLNDRFNALLLRMNDLDEQLRRIYESRSKGSK